MTDARSGSADPLRVVRIGVISDTHGKLSAAALHALAGVDAIVHAGDISNADIYWQLNAIAPVTAVLGNCDEPMPGIDIGPIANVNLGGVRTLVVHDVTHSGYIPDDVELVISGHTHVPKVLEYQGRLYVNPGSASRSRGHGHTVAIVEISPNDEIDARIVSLDD